MSEASLPSDRAAVCSQLLRQQDRALQQLQRALAEIDTPITKSLLSRIRAGSGGEVEAATGEAVVRLERAVHAVEHCLSETRRELLTARGTGERDAREHLPAAMERFLAERANAPGFSFQTVQDPVRGWVIRWKQQTADGIVRGAGQLCERPYAWLDE